MDKIAVLIPCYNESTTIGKVVKEIKKYLPEAKIYVFDNNSTDHTDEIAKKAGAIVRYERKQGKGNVIRSMFHTINAECYLLVDGDDTYSPKDAKKMCDSILSKQYDMVIGDRLSSSYFNENKRRFHGFGNVLVRCLINMIYHSKIRDVMTGYRAFSYRFVKTFPVISKGFEIETEMTIHALDKNLNIKNEIIGFQDRPEGSDSKLNTISDGIRVIKTIVNFYKNYKPFPFFCLLSLLFIIIGIAFLIPVLIDYTNTGSVPKMPSFVASVFFFLCAVQSFFGGLILQNTTEKFKQQFETNLHLAEYHFSQLKKSGAKNAKNS